MQDKTPTTALHEFMKPKQEISFGQLNELANKEAEQLDYINHIYAEQALSGDPQVERVNPAVEAYRQQASREAMSNFEHRPVSAVEAIAQATPEEMVEYSARMTKTIDYYTNLYVEQSNGKGVNPPVKAKRSDYGLAA